MCFVVLLAYSFIVFVLSSPLRPLSRVASDYFSDSVVCIEILRPLRPLREIKITSVFVFTQRAQRAQSFIYLSYSTLALEWSQTSLRQECAESFIHPLPPAGYYPCLRGRNGPLPALPCMGGSSYNRLVLHQQNIILPSIQGGAGGRVRFILQKPLHPSLRGAGRGNPCIVKARSSHEIRCEHELPGA